MSWLLDGRGLEILYKAQVRSSLEYACLAWGGTANKHLAFLDKVRIIEDNNAEQEPHLITLQHRYDVAGLTVVFKVQVKRMKNPFVLVVFISQPPRQYLGKSNDEVENHFGCTWRWDLETLGRLALLAFMMSAPGRTVSPRLQCRAGYGRNVLNNHIYPGGTGKGEKHGLLQHLAPLLLSTELVRAPTLKPFPHLVGETGRVGALLSCGSWPPQRSPGATVRRRRLYGMVLGAIIHSLYNIISRDRNPMPQNPQPGQGESTRQCDSPLAESPTLDLEGCNQRIKLGGESMR
ncbi:hypothetical protein GWK47_049191 [Chionoecetes opilio]|uniref:Uncharacterized protein n=1 Tax=Chionoecetes opilio TaxID=41210 RepID=A0A8J4Y9J7_CHIOP|nr:hypothetical protein GWK47_049191 [Chionoecetes opilio]